jgi:crotonobetainyl-CoA:carnitine CoA-transferase CaiB-like acyl-CoA transferase
VKRRHRHRFWDAADLAKLKNIIADSNILLKNFKVGELDKFGLDYESLKAKNHQNCY